MAETVLWFRFFVVLFALCRKVLGRSFRPVLCICLSYFLVFSEGCRVPPWLPPL